MANTDRILLTQIRIKNFKCFENVVVPLRRFTVIYGQNSSGKSTILQALDLVRLVCRQLKAKENQAVPEVDLKSLRWYGSFKDILRDPEKPLELGVTFRKGDLHAADRTYIAVDLTLTPDWEGQGERGGGLPKQMVFSYRFGNLDGRRPPGGPHDPLDIKVTVETRQDQASNNANRQFAAVDFSPEQVAWFTEKHKPEDPVAFGAFLESRRDWGKVPYFRSFEASPFRRGLKGTTSQNNKVFEFVNSCLSRTWKIIETHLNPDGFLDPDVSDSVHIPANKSFIAEGGAPRWRTSDTNLQFEKGLKRWLDSPDLIRRVNDALSRLGIPHTVTEAGGITDNRDLLGLNVEVGRSVYAVGYGIQYLLPRLFLVLGAKTGVCCIEEPEGHVHPRLQAELGGLFFDLTCTSDECPQLILESHSENLVLKVKRAIHDKSLEDQEAATRLSNDVLALYVNQPQKEQDTDRSSESEAKMVPSYRGAEVSFIRLDRAGDFVDYWPIGFFPERGTLYY